MVQLPASSGGPFRRAFRDLTYAAMTGSDNGR
jgi:hypothetical protein